MTLNKSVHMINGLKLKFRMSQKECFICSKGDSPFLKSTFSNIFPMDTVPVRSFFYTFSRRKTQNTVVELLENIKR